MDVETAEVVDTLRTDIRRVEQTLTGKIGSVERSLTVKVELVETSLAAKFDEQKRHADVHFESVHADIRMLAEHLVSLTVKVDSLLRR
jgi:hypothetical protein